MKINDLKVYVPARDFAMSKRFYAALGFEITEAWAGDVDCTLAGAVFRLQNYYNKDWAENFMMLFDVDDAREWFEHSKNVIDGGDFGPAKVAEPEEVGGSTICHVWDPSGILLIFIS